MNFTFIIINNILSSGFIPVDCYYNCLLLLEPWPPHSLAECSEPRHLEQHREHDIGLCSVKMLATDDDEIVITMKCHTMPTPCALLPSI